MSANPNPVREQLGEQADREADRLTQERAGAAAHNVGVQSPGYVHGVDPEHGEPVSFVPGELLPAWAAEALGAQRPEPDQHGVYHLAVPTKPRSKRQRGRPA
jgi:hypothetical protein